MSKPPGGRGGGGGVGGGGGGGGVGGAPSTIIQAKGREVVGWGSREMGYHLRCKRME